MFKIGAITVTRHKHYDELKHLICEMVLLTNDKYLPSIRQLSEMLGINKSSISRALLRLSEDDKWLEKIGDGSPRNSRYKILANNEQAKQYKEYYLLPPRKKAKFRKMVEHARQNYQEGTNPGWSFGDEMWTKFLLENT